MPHLLIHRGLAKKGFKENTIPAFKYCFKNKFGIETDLHVTKDKKIICFHDFSLKGKFKVNKQIKNTNFKDINKIAKRFKYRIPELKEVLHISKNRNYLMLEIKSLFSRDNLVELIKQTRNLKSFSITSFKEKNIKNIYKIKKNLKLGLCFSSTTPIKKILKKSKLNYIKILIMEKKFLYEKKLNIIKKPIYYYTAKNKLIRKKYLKKNLIIENL